MVGFIALAIIISLMTKEVSQEIWPRALQWSDLLCKKNYRYYIKEKKNAVDAQPAMQFVQRKPFLWWKTKKDLNIRR